MDFVADKLGHSKQCWSAQPGQCFQIQAQGHARAELGLTIICHRPHNQYTKTRADLFVPQLQRPEMVE